MIMSLKQREIRFKPKVTYPAFIVRILHFVNGSSGKFQTMCAMVSVRSMYPREVD